MYICLFEDWVRGSTSNCALSLRLECDESKKMVKEQFWVPHLLLDLLVSVTQGNLFSALPHDGSCVAVAAKQGESCLLKQAHKGFCSEKNKAAISASPDSCPFSQRGSMVSPLTPLWALLSWLSIKRHCERTCQGVSLPFSTMKKYFYVVTTQLTKYQVLINLVPKKQRKNHPQTKQRKKEVYGSINFL